MGFNVEKINSKYIFKKCIFTKLISKKEFI